ncbi:hypothetical protein PanWU01x14_060260 [Parasponia andersonii]|uniref:Uncharacterized protein n=1 Tax=Parasponia andersonii TaxID=3476 RepID=A0A2P5DIW0_PARAD|nr:hypothetical protein PanWU01x14_060260 [Parasponia andersonii]
MVVHKLEVRTDEVVLPRWNVDQDTCNYMDICDDLKEFLIGSGSGVRTISFDFAGSIRVGEHIIKVKDDKTVMELLGRNTNLNDLIVLHVHVKQLKSLSEEHCDKENEGEFDDYDEYEFEIENIEDANLEDNDNVGYVTSGDIDMKTMTVISTNQGGYLMKMMNQKTQMATSRGFLLPLMKMVRKRLEGGKL